MTNNLKIDVTAPGVKPEKGGVHPLTKEIREMEKIFQSLGFEIADGNWIETEEINFDSLNVPKNHPARDMQDTFWIKNLDETVLRTQTSDVQIRYMLKNEPPIRIISPGRVFRNESTDARHEAEFHQMEGLLVGENISVANFKAVIGGFFKKYIGEDLEIRTRPGYFPFVEPGFEIDVTCFGCDGSDKKCELCSGTGWVEIIPGGMVHPNVLRAGGIDPEKYQGFAFGLGVERTIMAKYGIKDIRDLLNSDVDMIKQFNK